jgi:hypothetical protein
LNTFQCEVQIPAVKGLNDGELTVGRLFFYTCRGDWTPQLQIENLQAQFKPAANQPELSLYALRVMQFELRDPQTADIKLVSYQPGNHVVSALNLTDGTQTKELPGFQVQVQSVLTEQSKPIGPMGPLSLGVPLSYWLILISVLGLFIFSQLWFWRKRKERIEILKKVQSQITHPNPLVQFHRELRFLTKDAGLNDVDQKIKILPALYLDRLRSLCELYWGSKFELALLGRSRGALISEFKNYAPKHYIKFERELLFWEKRWISLVKDRERAKFEDFQGFTQLTRELIEKMEAFES